MTDAERRAIAVAIVNLVETELRWRLQTTPGAYRSGGPADVASVALREFCVAAKKIAELVNPARPDQFVAKLQRVRDAVQRELDPLSLRHV